MIDRRLILKGFFVTASFAVSPSAFAFEAQTFDATLEAAQMAGRRF